MTPSHVRNLVRLSLAGGLIAFVAACGGGAAATSGATGSKAPVATAAGATTAPSSAGGSGSGAADAGALATLTPAATVAEALGETPTPECSTSVAFGGDSCVWTATDGSWVKVEHGLSQETPDLAKFTERMTKTLGLETPVAGLGEAAFMNTTTRGARLASYLGDGDVVWVVITKPGDAATQTAQLQTMAKAVIAGL